MRQDIREMSYVFQKEKQDKDFVYVVDLLLYKIFEKEFDKEQELNWSTDYVDRKYLELLKDKDGIITDIIENNYDENTCYFGNTFINDTYKLYYLIDSEYLKQLDKIKKYYEKRLKTRNKVKDKDLISTLKTYFEYCFVNCNKTNSEEILKLMSSSNFRKATIEDLNINTNNYDEFDKIYNKALNEFKKIHKDDIQEKEEQENKIGFGWLLYGTIKAIEGLFKL
jgi:hypothetical protein